MKKYLVLVSLFFISFINAYDRISLGSYAHYNSKPEHDNKPFIFTYDSFINEKNFYGIALFNNSFGQFSQFLYKGHVIQSKSNNLHYELTYGIIHGYKDEYQDRIPINTSDGIGLGLIPSIYYSLNKKSSISLSIMGSAGLIVNYSFKF